MAAQREAVAAEARTDLACPVDATGQELRALGSFFALHGRPLCGRRLRRVRSVDRPEAVSVGTRHGPVRRDPAPERQGPATISDLMPGSALTQLPDVAELARRVRAGERAVLARAITLIESKRADHRGTARALFQDLLPQTGQAIRVVITGAPGVGKSTSIDALGTFL